MGAILAPKHYIVNCPGQACTERAECMRYMRQAMWPRKEYPSGETIVQTWASYDIERQANGDCLAKLEPHDGAIARALMKAA